MNTSHAAPGSAPREITLKADAEGKLIATNPSWAEVLGWSEDRLHGIKFSELVHPDDLPHTLGLTSTAARGAPVIRFDNRLRHADGSHRWISWAAFHDGTILHATGRDITKERAAAAPRRDAPATPDEKLDAVGQLMGVIAHDLNNLLQGMAGSLELARKLVETGRADESSKFVNNAISSVRRGTELTRCLFEYSGYEPLQAMPVDVNQVIAASEDMLRRSLTAPFALDVVRSPALWLTQCDRRLLDKVIVILVYRARDAMPAGGIIALESGNASVDAAVTDSTAAAPGDYVCVSVTDSGKVIPEEVIRQVGDPFFTIGKIGLVAGLGLSRVHRFVGESGGYMGIDSVAGRGTAIRLYLPRLRDKPGSGAGTPAIAAAGHSP